MPHLLAFLGIFAVAAFLMVNAAPADMESAVMSPLKRTAKNLVKQLPQMMDEMELVDPPHIKFTTIPEDAVINVGSSFTLKCEAEGIPPPTVRWFFNDQPAVRQGDYSENMVEKLMNFGKTTIQLGTTVSKMSVDCATLNSEGVYRCVAENGYQTIEAAAEITVAEGNTVSSCGRIKRFKRTGTSPSIYMWTNGRVEVFGANAQMYCRANGQPKPKIEWMNSDGETVQASDLGTFDVLPSGDLIIRDASFAALGTYTCVVTNVHGSDRAEAFFYPSEPEDDNETPEEFEPDSWHTV